MALDDGRRVVLRVDSGADHPGSFSRRLADELVKRVVGPDDLLIQHAATEGLPVVTGAWVAAAFADGDTASLAVSNTLVDELLTADELILVAPIYNFGIPAAMKAWVDQVVRAGRTFTFTANGPIGLVTAKRAWIVTASGSTAVGSEYDFNTPYLRAVLGFIGITDVRVLAAEAVRVHGEVAIERAIAGIEAAAAL